MAAPPGVGLFPMPLATTQDITQHITCGSVFSCVLRLCTIPYGLRNAALNSLGAVPPCAVASADDEPRIEVMLSPVRNASFPGWTRTLEPRLWRFDTRSLSSCSPAAAPTTAVARQSFSETPIGRRSGSQALAARGTGERPNGDLEGLLPRSGCEYWHNVNPFCCRNSRHSRAGSHWSAVMEELADAAP